MGIIGFAGLISWVAFYFVLNKLDPYEAPGMGLGLFYLSLFVALVCTFSVIGFYFRKWLNRDEVYENHINIAFRQGVLLTAVVLGALTFQLLRVLTWWTGLILIFVVVLLEIYFMSISE